MGKHVANGERLNHPELPTGWYWDVFPTVSKQMMIRVSLGKMIWLQMRNALAVWFKHKTFRSGLIWLKTICWTLVSVLKPVGEQHGRGHSVQRPIWPADSSPTDPWNNQIDIDEASDWEWGRVSFVQFLKVRKINSQAYGRTCKNTSTLDASGKKKHCNHTICFWWHACCEVERHLFWIGPAHTRGGLSIFKDLFRVGLWKFRARVFDI